jgi:hypothetical protein
MDDSPSDADSQLGLLSPYPFQKPDEESGPLPDPLAIHLVPVPNWLPPYDDELPGAQNATHHMNQIWPAGVYDRPPVMAHESDELTAGQYETASASDPPLAHEAPHRDGPGPGGSGRPATGPPPEQDRQPDGGDAGDGVGQWPSQFAQVLAETLAGGRPASQLTPWTNERARAHIRRLGPLLAVDRRPRVRRVRASQPARDVVEVAVVAEFGSRTRALAARLERADAQPATPGRPGREARWLCTAIESA